MKHAAPRSGRIEHGIWSPFRSLLGAQVIAAAFGLGEDRVEARESELAELDERLRRKEDDLARYVGQVQAQLSLRG